MKRRTVALDELKDRTLEDVLWDVVKQRANLTVRLTEREAVILEPSSTKPSLRLKPLPALDGFVPQGWKDAVYDTHQPDAL